MKIKIKDRILAALLAILLLAGAAAIVAQTFFAVPVTETVKKLTEKNETLATKILPGVAAAVLVLLAVCCLTVLFRHRKKKDRFIRQVTEGGELQIGLDALGNLVDRCLEQHPEIAPEKVTLENDRNSLSVNIAGNVSGGISIPLTVSQLQKQIKQYVTACSGVEVKNVRVTIRNTGEDAKDAPFAIESPVAVPRLKSGAEEEENASVEAAQSAQTQEAPAVNAPETTAPETSAIFGGSSFGPVSEPAGMDEADDDRPLHQRLFSQPEEPCIVPCPPEMTTPTQTEEAEIYSEEETEPDTAEDAEADMTDFAAENGGWKAADVDSELPMDGAEAMTEAETQEETEFGYGSDENAETEDSDNETPEITD